MAALFDPRLTKSGQTADNQRVLRGPFSTETSARARRHDMALASSRSVSAVVVASFAAANWALISLGGCGTDTKVTAHRTRGRTQRRWFRQRGHAGTNASGTAGIGAAGTAGQGGSSGIGNAGSSAGRQWREHRRVEYGRDGDVARPAGLAPAVRQAVVQRVAPEAVGRVQPVERRVLVERLARAV